MKSVSSFLFLAVFVTYTSPLLYAQRINRPRQQQYHQLPHYLHLLTANPNDDYQLQQYQHHHLQQIPDVHEHINVGDNYGPDNYPLASVERSTFTSFYDFGTRIFNPIEVEHFRRNRINSRQGVKRRSHLTSPTLNHHNYQPHHSLHHPIIDIDQSRPRHLKVKPLKDDEINLTKLKRDVKKKGMNNVIPIPRDLSSSRLQHLFYSSAIVPDLIKYPPKSFLKVEFPSGERACLGNHLNFLDSLLQPTYNWEHKKGKLYTLLMIDPDSPIPETPLMSPLIHHMVVNIPGPLIHLGQTIISYTHPTVPPGSHFHRIAVLVFEQKSKIFSASASPINFNLKHFIRLNKLGTPVAGNFFYSKFYVTRKVIAC